MSYSYTRFRRVLAVVRIGVGFIFLLGGGIKLFDPSFFGGGFLTALSHISPLSPSWYQPMVRVLFEHPGWYAVAVGAIELFLGLALVLGLATRPASFVGMFYMLNRMAITWYPGGSNPGLYEYMDVHVPQVTMLCLFLLFAVGHAGETWGLGAIYHHQRFEKQKSSLRDHPEYSYLYEPEREEERQDHPAESASRN
jgi:uncharacterized membrane protein YphA (DoxX/SURF4 family)